jgi:hypothetical protein
MGHPVYSTEQIAALGREIYEKQLRQQLEPDNVGKYLVIDVETGEYEMDEDGERASLRAREKRPGSARYGMRIGCRAWGRIRLSPAYSGT